MRLMSMAGSPKQIDHQLPVFPVLIGRSHGLREQRSSLGRGPPAPRQPTPADQTAPPCPRAVWPLHTSHFESLMKAAPAPLQRL